MTTLEAVAWAMLMTQDRNDDDDDSADDVGLGSVVVRVLDLRSTGRGFHSQPPLGNLLSHMTGSSEVTTVWCYRNLINLIILFYFIL